MNNMLGNLEIEKIFIIFSAVYARMVGVGNIAMWKKKSIARMGLTMTTVSS